MKEMIARLLREDRGDDLIEYALLTTLVGLTGVLGFNVLRVAIGNRYSDWDTAQQGLWQMPNPKP